LAGAEVRVADSLRGASSGDGRFLLGGLSGGPLRFTIRAVGFSPYNASIRLSEGDTADVEVIVRPTDATRLPEVEVTESAPASAIPEFEERRKDGFGTFVTRAQLDTFGGATVTEVLRRKANRIQYVRHSLGGFALASQNQSMSVMAMERTGGSLKNCAMPKACYFEVFLDGVILYSPTAGGLPPQVDQFRAVGLEGIEVYRGGAQTPSRYSGSSAACGTILLWTRRAPP
ncbi:MAG: hypothetical protein H7066_16140, partial [Cytophagaceae bacterium]|nr:hypothetical protein [Gemmatimonadaceae bacterium]